MPTSTESKIFKDITIKGYIIKIEYLYYTYVFDIQVLRKMK